MSKKLFSTRIDEDLHDLINSRPESNQELVNSALWGRVGGEKKSTLDVRIKHKDGRIERLEGEIEDLQRELEKEKEERAMLVERRDELGEQKADYQDEILGLFQEFANSRAVLPRFRGDAQELADEHGKTLSEIEQDLRELAEESEYEIAEDRWTDGFGEGLA